VSSSWLCLAGLHWVIRVCTGLLSICLLENTHNLRIKFREFERQHRSVRMKDQVAAARQLVDMPPQHFAKPPLDPIALVRWTEDLADSKSDSRACRLTLCRQEPAHRCRAALPSFSVYALKIRVPAQSRASQRGANLARNWRNGLRLRL